MIPYFEYHTIAVGPFVIQVWGLMVSIGFVLAIYLAYRASTKYFLSPQVMTDLSLWTLVGGFVFARIFHVFFYSLDYYYQHPFEIIKIWQGGASSLGGFFGACLAAFMYKKYRHWNWRELLPYLDIGALYFWLGWAVGRLGCFLIHDHPGRLSKFFLAVNFSSGARHDLGLYDSLLAVTIFVIFYFNFHRFVKMGWGRVALYSFATYAVMRFFLDFLRATDVASADIRYLYLTPAQWGLGLTLILLTFVVRRSKISQPNV